MTIVPRLDNKLRIASDLKTAAQSKKVDAAFATDRNTARSLVRV